MSWTDERVELLTTLWNDGFSASQIAGKLGGVSRNAVIGKVHRLGLSGRGAPSRPNPTGRAPKPAAEPKKILAAPPPQTQPAPVAAVAPPPARSEPVKPKIAAVEGVKAPPTHIPDDPKRDVARTRLLDLQGGECKWPCGDPQSDEFGFCGAPRVQGLPYCAAHAARAFVASRKDDARDAARRAAGGIAHERKAAAGR